MKIKKVDGFNYELTKNDSIIGIITESKTDFKIILKPIHKSKYSSHKKYVSLNP